MLLVLAADFFRFFFVVGLQSRHLATDLEPPAGLATAAFWASTTWKQAETLHDTMTARKR